MTDRQARWQRRLERLSTEPPEPLILNEAMISQCLRDRRAEYDIVTYNIRAALQATQKTRETSVYYIPRNNISLI